MRIQNFKNDYPFKKLALYDYQGNVIRNIFLSHYRFIYLFLLE